MLYDSKNKKKRKYFFVIYRVSNLALYLLRTSNDVADDSHRFNDTDELL
jgi:hypothetical protein